MIDVLLICPKANRPFHYKYLPLSPPLGLGYLASALKMHGISFLLLDLYCTPMSLQELRTIITTEKPRMVCFMVYTESVSSTEIICKMIKLLDPSIITVAGGPHPTFQATEMLDCLNLDFSVTHEGEETIIELWDEVQKDVPDFSRIKGIAYRENDVAIKTSERPPIKNIDQYDYPDRSIFPHIERYLEPSTIISSRGCPGKCSFCGGANIAGGIYRARSADSIKDEIVYLQKLFPNDVTIFWDDAFGFDTNRLNVLCDMMQNITSFEWSCGMRVDRVTNDLLNHMRSAGCVKINFGVESGSQEILNQSNKGITLNQIRQAVQWACSVGIYNSCSMIIGHPNDTSDTIAQTLAFAEELLKNGATSCTFNALVPFPGTWIFENRNNLSIKFTTDQWKDFHFLNPTFETPSLCDSDIRKHLIDGLLLWAKYKSNRDQINGRLRKRDAILLGNYLGRNIQG